MPRDGNEPYDPPHDVGPVVDLDDEAGAEADAEKDADGEVDGAEQDAHGDVKHRNETAVTRSRNGRRRAHPGPLNGLGVRETMYSER